MSPRRRKAEDADVFAAIVRVMLRVGPAQLTLSAIAAEAGVTASALVQRFGSKRALLLAHSRHAAATNDIGFGPPAAWRGSPLGELRSSLDTYAKLATSPRAALRNLAYLQDDLADPVRRRHVLQLSRAARAHYAELVTAALAAGELRKDTDVRLLSRLIEVTLTGSVLAWTVYREGPAIAWLREDLDGVLRPYLASAARVRR